MICPSCGFEVDEQALTCPYCDAELTATSPLRATGASWCSSCGSLVGPDDTVCPACGAPCAHAATETNAAAARATDDTEAVLASAIPSEGDEQPVRGHTPAPIGRYVAAVCAGAVVLVALILAVWQPWAARDDKSERIEPIPSQSSPQIINALSGQDFRESTATRLGAQGSRTTFEWAHDGYEIMIGLAARLKANWALLDQVADGSLTSGLDTGRDEAQAIVSEATTLYQDIAGAPEDEDYLLQVGQLMNLVEWLRTSAQGVADGWDAAVSTDEDARGEAIAAALEGSGANEASSEFVDHYVEWEPTE